MHCPRSEGFCIRGREHPFPNSVEDAIVSVHSAPNSIVVDNIEI
jgi:hypothetical protein